MDKIQGFGKTISASFTPFANRTQQYVKESLGQADEKTQLPPDYIELERRVDALRQAHVKLLAITSQYYKEGYDYPANLTESVGDLGRTIGEKVTLLSSAKSASAAQAAFTAPSQMKQQPKTFSHALARASLSSSQMLQEHPPVHGDDTLSNALEKFALASEKVGEARLAQDAQIQSKFLTGWNTTLNTNLNFAQRARKNVENARLNLDAVKARVHGGGWSMPGKKREGTAFNEANLSEEQREQIGHAEDEFVRQIEEALSVMKNVRISDWIFIDEWRLILLLSSRYLIHRNH